MIPFEALTKEDKQMIIDYITAYNDNEAYGGYMSCSLEHLLRFWNINKQPLFDVFNGHLIHERNVCLQTPESILYEEMEAVFYPNNCNNILKFVTQFNKWCQYIYDANKLDYDLYEYCNSILSLESLVTNSYPWDDFVIPVPNQPGIKVTKGMKTMKIINKIVKNFPDYFTPVAVEEMRLRHSMVLNQKLFKGTMCLSIHPLDYMTMSDNTCDWDSCMSWQKPGEYRMGTVEMMNSEYVVVAYLKAHNNMHLMNNQEWNSKRWRELFIVTPNIVTNIKGYPFRDNILRDVAMDWIMELVKAHGWTYFDEEFEIDKIDGHATDVHGEKFFFSPRFSIMYDDYYSKHKAYLGVNIMKHTYEYGAGRCHELYVSGQTECMCCGMDYTEDYAELDTGHLQCPSCSGEVKCPNCGDYVSDDNIVSLGDSSIMCRDCYEYYGRHCDYCEEPYHRDDTEIIFLRHLDETLDEKICLCPNCLNNGANGNIGPVVLQPRGSRRSLWGLFYQADSRNLTTEGYYLFDIDEDEAAEMRAEIAEADEQKKS